MVSGTVRASLAALLVLAGLPSLLVAATIRGAVTDQSRAAIVGAKVTIKDEDTGVTRLSTTNSAGLFSFTDLAVGRYAIDVASPGFKTSVIRKIQLDVADARAVDVELAIGDVEEQVEVDASTLQVKTIGGEVASLVTGEQVRELPLNGRNFLQLALLMPGVSPSDGLNLTDKGLLSLVTFSVSGGAANANMFTVDGVNNNDVGSNGNVLISPSVDAIEEFKVHRNSYGAEYGQAAGAQVDIVTRAGTNRFQGSAYYFGRNEALDGTNYFLALAGKPREKLSYHDFGFTFGGPIVKDKLRFFVSQEWNRSVRGTVRSRFVPTAAERAGDFSGPVISGCTPSVPVDPLTGAAVSRRSDPARSAEPGRASPLAVVLAPQHDAARGHMQQLDRVSGQPDPLAPGERPARLDPRTADPPAAPLHPGQLGKWITQRCRPALGERSVPGRGCDLEPAGAFARPSAQPRRRLRGREHAPVLLVWQPDRHRDERNEPGPQRPAQHRHSDGLPGDPEVRRPQPQPSGLLGQCEPGVRLRRECRSPWNNQMDLLGFEGRLLSHLRQPLVEGRRALQFQSEERGSVQRRGRGPAVRFRDRRRRLRPDHRQRRRRSAPSGHDLRLRREVHQPLRAATLAGPGGVPVRFVEGPPTSHDRRRLAGFPPGQPLHHERRDHELRSGGVRSGTR